MKWDKTDTGALNSWLHGWRNQGPLCCSDLFTLREASCYLLLTICHYYSPQLCTLLWGMKLWSEVAGQAWWYMPLILGTLGAKEADFCAFKASLVYMVSFRTAEDMQRDLVSTNKWFLNFSESVVGDKRKSYFLVDKSSEKHFRIGEDWERVQALVILLYFNVNWETRDTDAADGSHMWAETGLGVGQLAHSWDLSGSQKMEVESHGHRPTR